MVLMTDGHLTKFLTLCHSRVEMSQWLDRHGLVGYRIEHFLSVFGCAAGKEIQQILFQPFCLRSKYTVRLAGIFEQGRVWH
jgi:hypothetical protein